MAAAQFADLAELCRLFKGQPFTLVCAPCAQFLNQEKPKNEDVHRLVLNHLAKSGGSFLVLDRLEVNGPATHPIYHFLKRHSTLYRERRGKCMPIPWNFAKFLVSKTGEVVEFRGPTVKATTLEQEIRRAISM